MERHDNPYNLFPKEGYFATLVHLHPGNSSKKQRENADYFSYFTVQKRLENGEKSLLECVHVTAKCCKDDAPSRSKARAILRLKAKEQALARGWNIPCN